MVLNPSRLIAPSLLALASATAAAAPFPSSDQNPLLAGHTLIAPARLAPDGTSSAQIAFDWSSISALQQASSESLTLDSESRTLHLQIDHALSDRVSLRLQLPYRDTSAGLLDSTIERWHNLFGLPNGDRAVLPRDRLHLEYQRGAVTAFDLRDGTYSGLGDIAIDLGIQLQANETSATSLWSSLYLPTGDPDNLTGTGTFSGALAIAHSRALGTSFSVFGHAGVHLGDSSTVLSDRNESIVWLAMVGLDIKASQNLTFTLQFDWHSAAFADSDLDLLGPAYILTLGGDYALPAQWRLQFGVAEDIQVETAPDVTFTMNVTKSWK